MKRFLMLVGVAVVAAAMYVAAGSGESAVEWADGEAVQRPLKKRWRA